MPILRLKRLLTIVSSVGISAFWLAPLQAQVPNVVPQGPRPDGSIVHVVQFQDTLQGIAFAYGVTMERLQELNGWRFPPQYIFVGQEIIIQPPITTAPPAAPPAESGVAPPPAEVVPAAPPAPNLPVRSSADIAALSPVEGIAPFLPILGQVPSSGAEAPEEVALAPTATEAAPPPANPVPSASPVPSATSLAPATTEAVPPSATPIPTEASPVPSATPLPPTEAAPPPANPVPSAIPIPTEVANLPLAPAPQNLLADLPNFAAPNATLCAIFFTDTNANGVRDADEAFFTGGTLRVGAAEPQTNNDPAPLCINSVPVGIVEVSAGLPAGQTFSTPPQLSVTLLAGRTVEIAFGVLAGDRPALPQADSEPVTPPDPNPQAMVSAVHVDSDDSLLDRLFNISGFLLLGLAAGFFILSSVATLAWRWLR